MHTTKVNELIKVLHRYSNKEKAEFYPRFFKTGKGQYGEGDIFIGVTVPFCRLISKKHSYLTLSEISELLKSKIHEERLVALFILIDQYKKGDNITKKIIFKYYLSNIEYINNWDLVDLSAPNIVGDFLLNNKDYKLILQGSTFKGVKILENLSSSKYLWHRRIAIISTFTFIKNNSFNETLKISKYLLSDKHDLIHKAVGWMLREVGKKNKILLEMFLTKNYTNLPRTTLRYAIEKFSPDLRRKYLTGSIFKVPNA